MGVQTEYDSECKSCGTFGGDEYYCPTCCIPKQKIVEVLKSRKDYYAEIIEELRVIDKLSDAKKRNLEDAWLLFTEIKHLIETFNLEKKVKGVKE